MGTVRLQQDRLKWAGRAAVAAWGAFDIQLVIYASLLAGMGLLMAYTNSYEAGVSPLASGSTFARGLVWAGLAIIAFLLAASFDYRWLKTFAWPLYFVNIGLLALSLAIGTGVGDTARWVTIVGMQFQFSELAKVLMAVVLANWISSREAQISGLFTIVGAAALVVPPVVLVAMQPDLGTSLVFAAMLVGTLFVSGASLRWLAVGTGAIIAAIPFTWTYVLRDYQKQRLISFLDPTADPQGSGYHVIQSLIAVGSGGLFGKGLTNGTQNQLDFLPVQSTDFVFSILAEELGFIGAIVVFVLFAALLWRVMLVAWRSDDAFGLAFASAIASMLLFQVLVNVGMTIGIMPVTGIPLPFITHGGASLISTALGLGVLESINLRQVRPKW
ncbi:MAG: rod shape-determining protein RodA [Candidatus Limnocylindrales bacterium]|jgi:rod shape determining protein RodA